MGKRGLAALFEAPSEVCCSFVANYLLLSELLRHLFLLTEKKNEVMADYCVPYSYSFHKTLELKLALLLSPGSLKGNSLLSVCNPASNFT